MGKNMVSCRFSRFTNPLRRKTATMTMSQQYIFPRILDTSPYMAQNGSNIKPRF